MKGMQEKARSVLVIGLLVAVLCACGGTIGQRAVATSIGAGPCGDATTWRHDLGLLGRAQILRIEPLYIRNTCDGTTQVAGTNIFIRADSSTAFSRKLRCGPSRIIVEKGQWPETATVWLPDGVVDVDLQSNTETHALVLNVHAESVSKNIELLRRNATR